MELELTFDIWGQIIIVKGDIWLLFFFCTAKTLTLCVIISLRFCSLIDVFFLYCFQGPNAQGPIKFTIADTLERIKEEFNFLQAQYHT